MKKIFAIFLIVLMLSFPLGMAQEETEESDDGGDLMGAGITPDSLFYGLDRALDSIFLRLSLSKEAKAKKGLDIAYERLLEIKKMTEEEKFDKAKKAEDSHDKLIGDVEEAIEKIKKGSEAKKTKENLLKIARIQSRIEEHQTKVSEVKDRILERQQERMSEEQIAKIESVFERIKEKAGEMNKKVLERRLKIKEKYKETEGKTDEEVEKEIDDESGLKEERKERLSILIEKTEKTLEQARERVEKEEQEGIDVSAVKEKIAEIESSIEGVRRLRDEGNLEEARDLAEDLKEFGLKTRFLAVKLKEARLNKQQTKLEATLGNLRKISKENGKKILEKKRLLVEKKEQLQEKQEKKITNKLKEGQN